MKQMRKKILSVILSTGIMMSVLPINVLAGSSSTNVGSYKLYVSCSTKSSTHQVTVLSGSNATYPTGSATVRYTLNGQSKTAHPTGTSYKTYWAASYSCPGSIYSAVTNGYGGTVTAYP